MAYPVRSDRRASPGLSNYVANVELYSLPLAFLSFLCCLLLSPKLSVKVLGTCQLLSLDGHLGGCPEAVLPWEKGNRFLSASAAPCPWDLHFG